MRLATRICRRHLGPVLAVSLAACGAGDTDAGGADALESLTRATEVTAGGSFEANFIMKKGAKITCDYSTTGVSLRWDVHTHEGSEDILDTGVSTAARIEFVAPSDGGFSLLWENLDMMNTDLVLSLTFEGDVRFHSWFPDN